jgi:predicted DNA binding CopG/RHH family protein
MEQVKDQPKRKRRQKIFLESGEELTPELEEELADEAERGYDLSKARRRFLKQPVLADGMRPPKITIHLANPELNAVRQRAEDEGRSVSDLAREALRRYLDS